MKSSKPRRLLRRLLWAAFSAFVLMNFMAFFHAGKFTRYAPAGHWPHTDPAKMSMSDKASALLFGLDYPKPQNKSMPSQPFETVKIQSEGMLEAWHIRADSAKGTVILFHGHGGEKSQMISKSDELLRMGYSTLNVDFRAAGGSEGYVTTIGFQEALDVKACFDHLAASGEKNIYLLGTSMGAAATLRAVGVLGVQPKGIILECPFGSLYEATAGRMRMMGVPTFPLAGLMVFWGGTRQGFWAFSHRPDEYAASVQCPTLLLWGEKDERVTRSETDAIFANLKVKKTLRTYPEARHENYLNKYREEWVKDVGAFLNGVE